MSPELLIRGLVVAAAIIAVAYVFVRTLQATNSFTKAVLAVSVAVDFVLVLMWLLGIDRPLFTLTFQRLGASVTVTALTLFTPLKIVFTVYLFLKQRQLQQALG